MERLSIGKGDAAVRFTGWAMIMTLYLFTKDYANTSV